MADEENGETGQAQAEGGHKTGSSGNKILPWIILGIVVTLFAGMGFGLGHLFASPKVEPTADKTQEKKTELPEYMTLLDKTADPKATWFYEIDPVVANLNDPGQTRYIRVSFALEMSGKMPMTQTKAYLDKNTYIIKDLISKYLATQSLKDLQGDRNLNRVPMEIKDRLNQTLFPNMEPVIVKVLYRERAIQ